MKKLILASLLLSGCAIGPDSITKDQARLAVIEAASQATLDTLKVACPALIDKMEAAQVKKKSEEVKK